MTDNSKRISGARRRLRKIAIVAASVGMVAGLNLADKQLAKQQKAKDKANLQKEVNDVCKGTEMVDYYSKKSPDALQIMNEAGFHFGDDICYTGILHYDGSIDPACATIYDKENNPCGAAEVYFGKDNNITGIGKIVPTEENFKNFCGEHFKLSGKTPMKTGIEETPAAKLFDGNRAASNLRILRGQGAVYR